MRVWAISAILVAGLLVTAPAVAQKPHDDVTTAEARARFNEGIKFADDGNHEAARLKFSQAWSLLKSPAILYNLARSEQLSGHPVEALEHYRLFGKMASDPKVTDQQRQRANENVIELSKKVGQVDVDAAPTSQITIDGKSVEWTSQGDPIPVLPGSHEVTATLDGKTNKVTVECTPGTVAKAALRESAKPAAPPPTTTAPVTEPPAETAPGFWTTGRAVGAGLAGVGLVGVGLGVVFHLKAGSTADEIDAKTAKLPGDKRSYCTMPIAADRTATATCSGLTSDADDVKSAETLRGAFLIGGGALLAGGVVLFLVSPPKKASEPARGLHFVPYASAQDAGITAFGRF